MSELTANEATALMAAGMYASPPTEAQMKDGIERAESWLAQHDREVKAEALREYATLVEEIANLGAKNTGLRTPHHLAEYTRNYAPRIAEGKKPCPPPYPLPSLDTLQVSIWLTTPTARTSPNLAMKGQYPSSDSGRCAGGAITAAEYATTR